MKPPTSVQDEIDANRLASGHWNWAIGWTMLLVGLATAATLDPWFLAPMSAEEFGTSLRWSVRHTHGVVLGMALLQLAMAHLLATRAFAIRVQRTAAGLTIAGVAIYVAGYALGMLDTRCHGLVLAGSVINLAGFACLLWGSPRGEYAAQIRMILPVACFGMLLDFTAGLLQVLPEQWVLDALGPDDGVRLRMMRLARVAVIALSVLTLLYYGIAARWPHDSRWFSRAGWSLACGAIGMPAILAASCFTSLSLKYLLPLPATAVSVGVCSGLVLALRTKKRLEIWGWGLIAASTSVGMLMGLYAFDGPLATPEFLGEYNDTARRLSRIAHSYSIVLGVIAIFLTRELDGRYVESGPARWGVLLFMVGSAVAVVVLVMQMLVPLAPWTFAIGPGCALVGTVACLFAAARPASQPPG